MSPQTDYDLEFDAQDRAETLDETNLTEDGEDIANFDDIEDVYDVTVADDDDDDEEDGFEEDDEDFDPDADPDEVAEELAAERDDEGQDAEFEDLRLSTTDEEAGGVANDDTPEEFEPDEEAEQEDEADPDVDRALDKGLKETFPASDPVSINPGAD